MSKRENIIAKEERYNWEIWVKKKRKNMIKKFNYKGRQKYIIRKYDQKRRVKNMIVEENREIL